MHMKTTMKTGLAALSLAALGLGFTTSASADAFPPAACAGCSAWVVSPDNGTTAFGQSVTILGNAISFVGASSGEQPIGTYGAGFTVNGGASMEFDSNLFTWDSAQFDNFIVTMSTTGYYWNTGMGAASWSWGGVSYLDGVMETYNSALVGSDTVSLFAAGPVYVSLVMQSTFDTGYASWGSFHVNVAALPEPETYAMLIAGLGLMGFVARRRHKKALAA
jgi:hypothetical protein